MKTAIATPLGIACGVIALVWACPSLATERGFAVDPMLLTDGATATESASPACSATSAALAVTEVCRTAQNAEYALTAAPDPMLLTDGSTFRVAGANDLARIPSGDSRAPWVLPSGRVASVEQEPDDPAASEIEDPTVYSEDAGSSNNGSICGPDVVAGRAPGKAKFPGPGSKPFTYCPCSPPRLAPLICVGKCGKIMFCGYICGQGCVFNKIQITITKVPCGAVLATTQTGCGQNSAGPPPQTKFGLGVLNCPTAIPGRSFFSVFVAPFRLPFRKASWQNIYLVFLF